MTVKRYTAVVIEADTLAELAEAERSLLADTAAAGQTLTFAFATPHGGPDGFSWMRGFTINGGTDR